MAGRVLSCTKGNRKALVLLAPMMHENLRKSQAGRKVMLPYGDSGCQGSALPLRVVEDGDFEKKNGILQASGKSLPNTHASWTEPCLEDVQIQGLQQQICKAEATAWVLLASPASPLPMGKEKLLLCRAGR